MGDEENVGEGGGRRRMRREGVESLFSPTRVLQFKLRIIITPGFVTKILIVVFSHHGYSTH